MAGDEQQCVRSGRGESISGAPRHVRGAKRRGLRQGRTPGAGGECLYCFPLQQGRWLPSCVIWERADCWLAEAAQPGSSRGNEVAFSFLFYFRRLKSSFSCREKAADQVAFAVVCWGIYCGVVFWLG